MRCFHVITSFCKGNKEREVSQIFDIGHWTFECPMSNIEYPAKFTFLGKDLWLEHQWNRARPRHYQAMVFGTLSFVIVKFNPLTNFPFVRCMDKHGLVLVHPKILGSPGTGRVSIMKNVYITDQYITYCSDNETLNHDYKNHRHL